MATDKPLTRGELAARYPDSTWRSKLLDLLSLVAILRSCIIDKNYKPSEELNTAIILSAEGRRVRDQLATKESVNAKDARVLTLLALVHAEPLVDVDEIDLDRLVRAVSNEVRTKALRFPLIFGRELYDRAADLFPEERDYLRHEDTLRLLEGMPQGVFQAGYFLVGPYGVSRVEHFRNIEPTTAVPLQHCADQSCSVVHLVQLATSIDAGVNRDRPALNKTLDQIAKEPAEWNGFVSDITEAMHNPYSVEDSSTLVYLLGDAFSDAELAAILQRGLDSTRGRLLAAAKVFELSGQVEDWLSALNRAEVLQLLLTESDASLSELLDEVVREEVVVIPVGEVRQAKVNARARSGAWRLRSQVSHLGVRSASRDSSLPLMRLSAMAHSLFDTESNDDMEELAWILRATGGETPREKLAEFLRVSEPATIVRTLVLARRSHTEKVCSEFGLPIDQDDEALTARILWKLGFPLGRVNDIRDAYWQEHDRLEDLTKTAQVTLGRSEEELRATSSNYFVALERFLFDSLIFATWALLTDHYADEQPFVFLENGAREFTISRLNASVGKDPDLASLKVEPELSQVVQGFTRLSKLIERLRGEELGHLRADEAYPKFAQKTALQKFPFQHDIPVLDLTPDSQVGLVEALAAVGSALNDSGIMTARNGLLHAKQRVPTVQEINGALTRARTALDRLEAIGCVRSTYALDTSEINSWGRWTTTLKSNGRLISLSSPSAFEWIKFPALSDPQYMVHGAVFSAPNEMLRFREGFESEYQSYWTKFPRRREPGNKVIASQSESLSTPMETGTYVASRAD